jgi:aminopeptidase-like protein
MQKITSESGQSTGQAIYDLVSSLFPICRSITGNGVRESLKILGKHIPLQIREVATGTSVFDWTIPREWDIREAWIRDSQGNIVVDFKDNNLHILNYSVPFQGTLNLQELKKHLFTIPEKPDLIPYRTSYYQENWGFCLSHRQLQSLREDMYEVYIDTSLEDGFLTYGELLIPGAREDEFLLSAHICHPSLANDNLSGVALLTLLARELMSRNNQLSYRFLFIPGTIGSICWLAQNEKHLTRIKGGMVASLLGDGAAFHYKKSRDGFTTLDGLVQYALETSGYPYEILDFAPYGYDERQFCSPGINLPVGSLTRSTYGYYEYHTSADNLDFISADELQRSYDIYRRLIAMWDENLVYLNLSPKGEPQLGKRGLYQAIGGESDRDQLQMAMLWVLNLSDGQHTLLEITRKSKLPFQRIVRVVKLLESRGLLKEVPG